MSLRQLLKPAIKIARQGFVVDATLSQQAADNAARFADFPATAALYLPGGEPIKAGAVIRNPDLANTYALVGRRGVKAFYRGQLARDIVATVKRPPVREGATRTVRPGLMETNDLRDYRAIVRLPALTRFRGFTIAGMGAPSSGATTVGEALNIIESFGDPAPDAVTEMHRYLEASRLAYADRGAYLGDPHYVHVPQKCLLSQRFADERAALIGESAGTSPAAPGNCPDTQAGSASTSSEGPSTTNLTVADRSGTIVEYTFTIEQTGGSGITVPGRGFILNNELTDFEFGSGRANSPASRKRPRSSIAPTIVFKSGIPVLGLGSPGGATIITTVLQVLVNRIDRQMSLADAIAEPRVSQRNATQTEAEPAFLQSPLAAALQARGHSFKAPAAPEIGAATAIEFLGRGKVEVAAEPKRRGGGSATVVSTKRR
jgi:gamma-glutamyltranspeptidase/glutathione hydrolase